MLHLLAFLARRVVPFAAAWVAGWVVGAVFGLVPGLVAAAVVALGAELVMAWVRQRTPLRWLVRVAVLLHVAFWSWQGVLHTPTTGPGPVRLLGADAAAAPVPFAAGFGHAAFALPPTAPLAGWGSPPRRQALPALGGLGPLGALTQAWMAERGEEGTPRRPLYRHPSPPDRGQALGARAFWLQPDGAPPLALVSVDLVTTSRTIHRRVLEALAADELEAHRLLLAATHTHSGPGGFRRERFAAVVGTDHFDPRVEDAVVDAIVKAVRAARDDATPATIAWAQVVLPADQPLGRGRGPLRTHEEHVGTLLVTDADGRPRGAVVHAAVHPTVLRRTYLRFDRDLAGAIETRLGQELGGVPVLFVNGAFGDVAPAPTPDAPHGQGRLLALAERATAGLLDVVHDAPRHERLAVRCAAAERDMGTARAVTGWGSGHALHEAADRPLFHGSVGDVVADGLLAPLDVAAWSLFLPEVRFVGSFDPLAFGVRVDLQEMVEPGKASGQEALAAGVVRLDAGSGASLTWLWTPGEATRSAGATWAATARTDADADVWVLGVTNGGAAYLADPDTIEAGGYEAAATLYGAQTAHLVGELLDASLAGTR
ncbi:MAG: neutral/alkaline non-lysosomal ceramidase N-terminal domain-containing protein [Planctomycetes bacterium]|nr:neutral/alkaline non-lysosomal ceramidase N-terminal domain-containing protein [Planctomycetota bacterium]MCB9825172.1 neutral/alkaline non-lysosomal ceramidase N-terminal domain-containing protein [Planctomycetota bacterium]MCB9901995.1 neutral/alkaline non-lysosomal ceramidase N-terminal domain-containing protein [Planctomycetota bacterium]